MTKKWYRSKTLWANVAAGVFLVLQVAGVAEVQLDPQIETLIVVVANIVLRFVTAKKLG